MNQETFNNIIELLTSLMENQNSRHALVDTALLNEPVVKQIDFSGSAQEFTTRLVKKLDNYGKISTDELALVVLLQATKEQVGLDKQAKIDQLIRDVTTSVSKIVKPPKQSRMTGFFVGFLLLAILAIGFVLNPFNGDTTSAPTDIPTTTGGFPCQGQIVFTSGALLNQVKVLPSDTSPARPPVQQGSTVTIIASQRNEGRRWYQIEYGDNSGWIPDDYVDVSSQCP